ncbi:hypothetical protein PFY12_01625 [Chryseobacterium camelliae]|uniref:Uncharacterized protein n=1 Tax=Chryseobacterium camelliae TaxID=1265445 RepID=A0ABY7QMH2_9FLAO|nr:hypothetical protein [Chryseobacterium camelliae]WBV60832.1 hypothetical protein PFY12_01625 [Chryseobacterium camelliae]
MIKLSKNREKYLLEKYFNTKNNKNIPVYLSQFGCRDSDLTDEDLYFITQYVTHIDRLAIGGSFVTEEGLQCLEKLKNVEYLDLRSMPLNDDNLDCILHLENLEYLYIKFTDVTVNGISKILQSFPKLQTLLAGIPQNESHLIEIWQKQYPEIELIVSIK